MNRNRFYVLIISLLLISNVLLASLIFLKNQHPSSNEGPKQVIIEKLKLNENQIKEYEKLIQKHRLQIEEHELSLNKTKQKLYIQLKDKTSNTDSLYAAIAAEYSKIEQINFEHFEDIKNLCKPEQMVYFDALTEELAVLFSPKHPPKK